MSVTVDVSPLEEAVRRFYTDVADNAVQGLFLDMERDGPRSDGPTGDSSGEHMTSRLEIVSEAEDASSITRDLRSPADYSSFVDEGTAAHKIEGNPLLTFQWHGVQVIVHSVNHPGTPRTGWWTDSIAKWPDYVREAMR